MVHIKIINYKLTYYTILNYITKVNNKVSIYNLLIAEAEISSLAHPTKVLKAVTCKPCLLIKERDIIRKRGITFFSDFPVLMSKVTKLNNFSYIQTQTKKAIDS